MSGCKTTKHIFQTEANGSGALTVEAKQRLEYLAGRFSDRECTVVNCEPRRRGETTRYFVTLANGEGDEMTLKLARQKYRDSLPVRGDVLKFSQQGVHVQTGTLIQYDNLSL